MNTTFPLLFFSTAAFWLSTSTVFTQPPNLIPENCQRCEDEESITAKAVIPPHPASSYVETYVGRAVPTGQYR
ncbi:TPA: hypothetical protein ACGBKJ_004861, partial [Escherichia coli]